MRLISKTGRAHSTNFAFEIEAEARLNLIDITGIRWPTTASHLPWGCWMVDYRPFEEIQLYLDVKSLN